MGPIEARITDKLTQAFSPELLQVDNESHMHSVPAGSESHFKVVIVTDQFEGRRLVQRHQSIYALLADELKGSVHALALHTCTVFEWTEKQGVATDSPPCLGGSKAD